MYDAIVVGARCAGAPLAMLLARRGHSVLLVDKAAFPSDTISSHMMHHVAGLYLHRWGLLERLVAAGTPPIRSSKVFVGDTVIDTSEAGVGGVDASFAPRRTVLDALLVEAAAEAGVELRERFAVTALETESGAVVGVRGSAPGGREVSARARIVVGADGRQSVVARLAGAASYDTRPADGCGVYAYWSDFAADGIEFHASARHGVLLAPTNGGLTCVLVAGFDLSQFARIRGAAERTLLDVVSRFPSLADRLRTARVETRVFAWKDHPNRFRVPHGEGWALAGDAGYYKHPVTGLGMSDAFRDADALATAIHEGLSGARPMGAALDDFHAERDAHAKPLYDLTHAILEPGGDAFTPFAKVGELSRQWSARVARQSEVDPV